MAGYKPKLVKDSEVKSAYKESGTKTKVDFIEYLDKQIAALNEKISLYRDDTGRSPKIYADLKNDVNRAYKQLYYLLDIKYTLEQRPDIITQEFNLVPYIGNEAAAGTPKAQYNKAVDDANRLIDPNATKTASKRVGVADKNPNGRVDAIRDHLMQISNWRTA